MFAIEIEVAPQGGLLVSLMSQMRVWLDQHRIEPSSFQYIGDFPRATVCVAFNAESEASAFAEHFGGTIRHAAPGFQPVA